MKIRTIHIMLLLFVSISLNAVETSNAKSAKITNDRLDEIIMQINSTTEKDAYYPLAIDAVKTAVLCDYYDTKPDKKGRVRPRYREENSERVSPIRAKLPEAGMYYYTLHKNEEALEAMELYLETAEKPLFQKDNADEGIVAYYASLLSFDMDNMKKAEHYADLALKDPNYAKDAAEIKINCMRCRLVTKADSTKYIVALLELHDKAPENRNYFHLLMEYFTSPGHENEVMQFALDEIRKDSTNKEAWALKGEKEMTEHRWSDAIGSMKKVVELDSLFVPAIYNIGICHSSQAIDLKEKRVDSKGRLTNAARKEVRAEFAEATQWLERCRRLDPDRKKVEWALPLYQAYFALGESAKAESLKSLIEQK